MTIDIKTLTDRFLTWPLPETVCADACATDRDYKFPRSGTCLLTADEARQMIEHLLADPKLSTALRIAESGALDAAEKVWKSGGKYGGPGVIVSRWKDEQGDDMVTVAHKIEGGYGTFKHIYPAKIVEPMPALEVVDVYPDAATRETRRGEMQEAEATMGPVPSDDARKLALAVKALRGIAKSSERAGPPDFQYWWDVARDRRECARRALADIEGTET